MTPVKRRPGAALPASVLSERATRGQEPANLARLVPPVDRQRAPPIPKRARPRRERQSDGKMSESLLAAASVLRRG
jgi:hypothetical protein